MNKIKDLIQDLGKHLFESHKRFPITMFFSLVASIFLFYYFYLGTHKPEAESYSDYSLYSWKYLKIAMLAGLGISFSFALTLWSEINLDKKIVTITWLVFLLSLGCFGYFSSWENSTELRFIIRFLVLALAGHLLVAFLPFIKNDDNNQFWFYNKSLLICILTAFSYTIILSGGLSLALLSIEKLFNIDLDNSVYTFIWVFFNGYINTGLFLSGIAKKETNFSEEPTYPIALKYFTQFVLLPLVVVYISILLAYSAKILVEWNLPKGWVCILILISGVFGILAFLLIHPLKSSKTWVVSFNRYFCFLMLPLVVLLFISIYVRIGNYGITESRYLVVLLGLWLFGIILYFIFSTKDDIRIIPMSLFIMTMLSIIGPWSAFSVSNRSQLSRFEDFLSKNKISSNGKIDLVKTKSLGNSQKVEIREIIEYFDNKEKVNELQPFFEKDLSKLSFNNFQENAGLSAIVKEYLVNQDTFEFFNLNIEPESVIPIKGYDQLHEITLNTTNDEWTEIKFQGVDVRLKLVKNLTIAVEVLNQKFEFDLKTLILPFKNSKASIKPEQLKIEKALKGIKIELIVISMNTRNEGNPDGFDALNGYILIKNPK